jgi:hypothetical protein
VPRNHRQPYIWSYVLVHRKFLSNSNWPTYTAVALSSSSTCYSIPPVRFTMFSQCCCWSVSTSSWASTHSWVSSKHRLGNNSCRKEPFLLPRMRARQPKSSPLRPTCLGAELVDQFGQLAHNKARNSSFLPILFNFLFTCLPISNSLIFSSILISLTGFTCGWGFCCNWAAL